MRDKCVSCGGVMLIDYGQLSIVVKDLFGELLNQRDNTLARMADDVRALSAKVRQFDDTTKLVGALSDRIADSVAKKMSAPTPEVECHGLNLTADAEREL